MTEQPRWQAKVHYRHQKGPRVVTLDLAELTDLHDSVEAGPHWDTIIAISVQRINHCTSPDLTVEDAEKL